MRVMNPSVHVRSVDDSLRDAVLALAVHPGQLPFVGHVSDSLADVHVCPESEALALLHEEAVVGYVRIDRRATALGDHPLAEGAVALRSFLIDASRQGQGLGGAALEAIRRYVTVRHPDRKRILLTVNVRNAQAVRSYLRAGYRDSGELYHGGRAGPQHVLWCPLSPTHP
jgi:GNAT superfamily N-acetyltransferase